MRWKERGRPRIVLVAEQRIIPARAQAVAMVTEQLDLEEVTQAREPLHVGRIAEHWRHKNRDRLLRDSAPDFRGVEVERVHLDVDEHRREPVLKQRIMTKLAELPELTMCACLTLQVCANLF